MMKAFYKLFIALYPLSARLLSVKNEKAARWVLGRKNIFERLTAGISHDRKIIWVHCASLGEFEQGRPLIEQLRKVFPETAILLTFFSPSGYEIQRQYSGADYVFYLPMDSKRHAERFFDIVQPALVIFIKYEFWYYYIREAAKRSIPVLLASGIFRRSQPFFQWYGGFYREMLGNFTWMFVQDQRSAELLATIGISSVAVTGDTRFDRVRAIADQFTPIEAIDHFCGGHPVIVAGSTWTEDDKELAHFANSNRHIRFIIAPHNVSKARIAECLLLYNTARTFSGSATNVEAGEEVNVLVIDSIGLLSRLYHYATIAFVGGGFGADGVHNVLEAAVYGKPVVFGPEYEKYIEAVQLTEKGGGFPVENALELETRFNLLLDDEFVYRQSCLAAASFIKENVGATEKIIRYIQEKRLFTT
ncbi:MAG TPA: glycosyltransferase N-terminal domain-containing protein [Chitinophagaceae bacterium]